MNLGAKLASELQNIMSQQQMSAKNVLFTVAVTYL